MIDIAAIVGALLALGCLCLAAGHSWTVRRITLLDWTVLAIGGVYGIGWALVALVTRSGGNPSWANWLLPNQEYFLFHTACVLVLVCGIVLGWIAGVAPNRIEARVGGRDNGTESLHQIAMISAWLMLLLAGLTQWIYSQSFGGFIGALSFSAAVRSAIFTVDNPWSFLSPFGSLAYISSFIFFGLLLSGPRRTWLWVSFAFSVLCSLYVLLSHLGRVEALLYFVTIAAGYFSYRVKRPLVLLAISGFGAAGALMGVYWLSFATGIKFTEGVGSFLATELAFPFVSFFAHVAAGTELRWFYDILVMPVFVLPTSIWMGWIEDLGQVNTAFILGAPKEMGGVTGAIPVDLLTVGMLQASVPGVLVVGALFGFTLRILDRLMQEIVLPGVRTVLVTYVALKVAVLGLFYAQPALLVKGQMHIVVAAFLYIAVRSLLIRLRDARSTSSDGASRGRLA